MSIQGRIVSALHNFIGLHISHTILTKNYDTKEIVGIIQNHR